MACTLEEVLQGYLEVLQGYLDHKKARPPRNVRGPVGGPLGAGKNTNVDWIAAQFESLSSFFVTLKHRVE